MLAFNFARRKPVIRANIDALPLPSPTSLLCGLDYRALDASRFRLFIPRNLPLLPFSSFFFFTLKRRKTRAYSFTRVTNRWPFKNWSSSFSLLVASMIQNRTEQFCGKLLLLRELKLLDTFYSKFLLYTYFPRSLHPLRPIITYLDHSYHPESI